MATTLANIVSLVNDRRRDTGTNSIDMTGDGFRAICSALQLWNQMHDWEFQVEKQTINYNEGITSYPLASDYKAPIDLRYFKGNNAPEFDMVSQSNFDSETLKRLRFAISTVSQVPLIRLKASGLKLQIHTGTAYNSDGIWVGATAISNVATDSYEAFEMGASISFDYSGTTGTLTNSTMGAKDLSKMVNRSNLYFNIYLPSVTNLTSITLKWGTDASNYYTASATTDYLGNALVAGQWNKVKFAWSSPTQVGTPTSSSIKYLQMTIAFSSNPSSTGFRVENFFVAENVPLVFEYYGQSLVKTAAGVKTQVFASSAATTDLALWTGQWDWVTESFVESVLEIIFWMTGEYDDKKQADDRVKDIVDNLKRRIPTRRRYPTTAFKFAIT